MALCLSGEGPRGFSTGCDGVLWDPLAPLELAAPRGTVSSSSTGSGSGLSAWPWGGGWGVFVC